MASAHPAPDDDTLAHIVACEDAALNATATPAHRWLDGWLLRLAPESTRRVRCVHALTAGHGELDARLAQAQSLYRQAGLPLLFRITPQTPAGLDAALRARGYTEDGLTQVMILDLTASHHAAMPAEPSANPTLPAGAQPLLPTSVETFVQALHAWRRSPMEEVHAHTHRLSLAPVQPRPWVWRDRQGQLQAGGQVTTDAALAGLYELHVEPAYRRQGVATRVCQALLRQAAHDGARHVFLQVDTDNQPARALYRRLGFRDLYRYHYLQAPQYPTAHSAQGSDACPMPT